MPPLSFGKFQQLPGVAIDLGYDSPSAFISMLKKRSVKLPVNIFRLDYYRCRQLGMDSGNTIRGVQNLSKAAL
jgi:hypothetical protein